MGTWSIDSFGNDDACDWVEGLEQSNDLALVKSAVNVVIAQGAEYLEAPTAAEALAAIEVIACLQGNWGEPIPSYFANPFAKNANEWVKQHQLQPPPLLAQNAHRVIERILAKNSELNNLWRESEKYGAWVDSVIALKKRVNV